VYARSQYWNEARSASMSAAFVVRAFSIFSVCGFCSFNAVEQKANWALAMCPRSWPKVRTSGVGRNE